jgi:glycosyltransferase involved in cell wall biosynthesis
MDEKLLVSIIINNYNYDSFLAQAIDSALNQTYPHTEVIIVDDGSTDNSRKIIARYGDCILPLLQPNGKQGAAFNNGFAHSKGDIIIFLDSDDYLYPNAVERIVAAWKPDTAKAHYRLDVVDIEGNPKGFSFPGGRQPLGSGDIKQSLLKTGGYSSVPTSGNALNRQVMEQIFPIPIEFNTTSDDYLSVLIPLYGKVIAIEEALGAYRLHNANQWALVEVSASRFRRFVKHDLQKCALLKQKGRALGYEVPEDLEIRTFGRVWSRLVSLRLEPSQHLVTSDRPLQLVHWGIQALWRYSNLTLSKRILFSLWFVWAGLMPLPLAKLAIDWLFMPSKRLKPVNWIGTKLRNVFS